MRKIYRILLLVCAAYFLSVAIAHQTGIKIPMLFIFYDIQSERYQDLIISFLSFGWAMLFVIGFLDNELRNKIQIPILASGTVALLGLIRARTEIKEHNEINYEITALALLLLALLAAYYQAAKKTSKTTAVQNNLKSQNPSL